MMKSTIKITLTEIQEYRVALLATKIITASVAKLKLYAHPTQCLRPGEMRRKIANALLGIQKTQTQTHANNALQMNIKRHLEVNHALHAPTTHNLWQAAPISLRAWPTPAIIFQVEQP